MSQMAGGLRHHGVHVTSPLSFLDRYFARPNLLLHKTEKLTTLGMGIRLFKPIIIVTEDISLREKSTPR